MNYRDRRKSLSPILAAFVLICASVLPCAGADDDAEKPPAVQNEVQMAEVEKLFRSAFDEENPPARRQQALEDVIEQYPKSEWADDALWTLAQWQKKRQKTDEAIKLLTQLADDYLTPDRPASMLERFTQAQDVYLKSRIPVVLDYIKVSGMFYVGEDDEGKVVKFNPLPMTVHEDLAKMWYRKGNYRNSIRHFELALNFGPLSGKYKDSLEHQLAVVKKRLEEYEKDAARFGIKPDEGQPLKNGGEGADKERVKLEDYINIEELKPEKEGEKKPSEPEKGKGEAGEKDKKEK
ncbi:MAG TPA: tetratricopeptide repeat protein [Candidatus Brocadiia bacterium]|nr:tetratricopeptide repeat protein [Candidatus Brocadiia bacterium]